MLESIYTSGEYLQKNPTWHVEESPWKATQILRMMKQSGITPKTIREVGCGAGEVLKQLQEKMEETARFGDMKSLLKLLSFPNLEPMRGFISNLKILDKRKMLILISF